MIKKLKRNIQLLLISILGITIVGVFVTMGVIENTKIIQRNQQALNSTLYNLPVDSSSVFGEQYSANYFYPNTFLAEYLPASNQFVANTSNWAMDNDTFILLMQEALNNPEEQGTILNETVEFKKDTNALRTRIAFLDLSESKALQHSLWINLIGLLSISLIILGLLSYYLSNKLIKPIEDSLSKQKQFIADASHELKNPLTILANNTTILKNNRNQTIDSQINWIESQEVEISRMNKLVHHLLYLAQSDSEHYQLTKTKLNLTKLVQEACLSYDSLFFEKDKQLVIDNLDQGIYIWANKESLHSLLGILLDNALKYSHERSETHLSLKKNVLTLSNYANDLSQEQLEHLFDRFYRTDFSRSKEGFGLGLAIAYEIIQDQGGQIKVTSKNGVVTFTLQFSDKLHKDQKLPSDDRTL